MTFFEQNTGHALMVFVQMISMLQGQAVEILRYIVGKMKNSNEEEVKFGWEQLLHWAEKQGGANCNDRVTKLKLSSPEEAKGLLEKISPITSGDVYLLEAVRILKKHFRIWGYEISSD